MAKGKEREKMFWWYSQLTLGATSVAIKKQEGISAGLLSIFVLITSHITIATIEVLITYRMFS